MGAPPFYGEAVFSAGAGVEVIMQYSHGSLIDGWYLLFVYI